MKQMRGSKALAGLAVLLIASLSQAQSVSGGSSADTSAPLAHAVIDGSGHPSAHRAGMSADHGLKAHHDTNRLVAPLTTPVVFTTAPAGALPSASRGGGLKGWVLLLMGAFLIITISQRRYQALSDI